MKKLQKKLLLSAKNKISKLLAEVGLSNSKSYSKATHSIEEIVLAKINYCKKFDLSIKEIDRLLPIIYWLPNMQKTFIGARFIVASKNSSTEPLPDTISKIFKMIFNAVESFHDKSLFYSGCKKFWVVSNSFPIVTKLNKINVKKKT